MDKIINTAMYRPETAGSHFIKGIDLCVGDYVQVRSDGKEGAGRVGIIIGIRYGTAREGKDVLRYHVQFSETESIETLSGRLRLLNKNGRTAAAYNNG